MDQEQYQHLQDLLQIHRHRLRPLEKRAALLGTNTPPEILIEIENIQTDINKIENVLRALTSIDTWTLKDDNNEGVSIITTYSDIEDKERMNELSPKDRALSIKNDRSTQSKEDIPLKAAQFFSQNYVDNSKEFRLSFRSAKELCVAGIGQTRMIIAYSGQIKHILQMGGKIRFILIDPEGHAMNMASQRSSTSHDIQLIKQEHRSALDRLASPARDLSSTGQLEIKLVDFLLPFTIYGFDLYDLNQAKIFIWITTFREPSELRPGFVVSAAHDPEWFGFFRDQFEKLWNWDQARACDITGIFPHRTGDA